MSNRQRANTASWIAVIGMAFRTADDNDLTTPIAYCGHWKLLGMSNEQSAAPIRPIPESPLLEMAFRTT